MNSKEQKQTKEREKALWIMNNETWNEFVKLLQPMLKLCESGEGGVGAFRLVVCLHPHMIGI